MKITVSDELVDRLKAFQEEIPRLNTYGKALEYLLDFYWDSVDSASQSSEAERRKQPKKLSKQGKAVLAAESAVSKAREVERLYPLCVQLAQIIESEGLDWRQACESYYIPIGVFEEYKRITQANSD